MTSTLEQHLLHHGHFCRKQFGGIVLCVYVCVMICLWDWCALNTVHMIFLIFFICTSKEEKLMSVPGMWLHLHPPTTTQEISCVSAVEVYIMYPWIFSHNGVSYLQMMLCCLCCMFTRYIYIYINAFWIMTFWDFFSSSFFFLLFSSSFSSLAFVSCKSWWVFSRSDVWFYAVSLLGVSRLNCHGNRKSV